jgi:putative FmdB family regulatory protein
MPIYDYNCPKCGQFEALVRNKKEEVKFCPQCGSKIEKIMSLVGGFNFKGNGWYETDYKKK